MKIVTSLSFRGDCREAFEFYARVLGGKITAAIPYGEGFPGMPIEPKYKDQLMHCWMDVGDQSLMGSDGIPEFAPGYHKDRNGFDVTLHTPDLEEGRRWYNALSEGGTQTMPFAAAPWSPGFGGLIDRFGVPWMINVMAPADQAAGA